MPASESSINKPALKSETFNNSATVGTLQAIGGYLLWGLFPIYWALFNHYDPTQLIALRILVTFASLGVVLLASNKLNDLLLIPLLKDKKLAKTIVLSSVILGTNWFSFVYAINQGNVTGAGLGYLICPICSVIIGRFFLKENMKLHQILAVLLVFVGLGYKVAIIGEVPLVSLIIALTFAFYGYLKRNVKVPALTSLYWESLILSPICLWVVSSWIPFSIDQTPGSELAIMSTMGLVTVLPLYFFVTAAPKIELFLIGLLQYITPTMHLLGAIFYFKEPFGQEDVYTFGPIFLALVFLVFGKKILKAFARNKVKVSAPA